MYIVMGMPGAGKTTVLAKAMEKKKGYEMVNYGDMIFELAKKKHKVKNRDEVRKLPPAKQKALQMEVEKRLIKLSNTIERIILDTHCSIKTPSGYLPGLPQRLLEKLKVDGLILISASIDEIMGRRARDETRIRDKEERAELEEHDFINRAMLSAYATMCGAPAIIIMNHEGKVEEAAEKLASILK
ncbi:MAG: adenylate kinase [Candidatus Anstonellales archaeon]